MKQGTSEIALSESFWLDSLEYTGFFEWFSDLDALAEIFLWHSPMFYDPSQEPPLGKRSKIQFWIKYLEIKAIKHTNTTAIRYIRVNKLYQMKM